MSNKFSLNKRARLERKKIQHRFSSLPKQFVLAVCLLAAAVLTTAAQTTQSTPPPQPRPETQVQPTPPVQTPAERPQPATPNQTQPNAPTTNPNVQTPPLISPSQSVGSPGGIAPAKLPDDPPPIAPNFQAPARPLPSADRVGVDIANQLPLSLQDAITLALQNNNDIEAAKNDVEIAEFNLRAAQGVYDPLLASENFYESRTTPTASTIGGASNGSVTQTTIGGGFGLNGFSPVAGGAYNLDFTSSRVNTTNQNATLNPQFPTGLTFTYTQPLWRGLRTDNNRRTIAIAKKNLSLTDAQFRQRSIDIIAQVEQLYWDLAYALRSLQVQIDAVKQARLQLESNQRLVEKGALAPIEIVAASTQVTTFEQTVYAAQEAVTRAENNLKTLMLPDRSHEIWAKALVPVTPVNLQVPNVQIEQAVAGALANRQELAQLKTNAEINQINERFYRDQTKPQIDLFGSYTGSGLAGSPTQRALSGGTTTNSALQTRVNELSSLLGLAPIPPAVVTSSVVPENLVGGYFKSLSNLLAADYPTYRFGVRISLPIGNRTAKANLGRTLVEGERIKNQQDQAEQVIEAEVRNITQSLRSWEARLQSAAASRASAEQLYESEQRQFRAGTSTMYLVFQRQTDLVIARARELQAQTDLNKAISEFQRATGTTLSANNVEITKEVNSPNFVFNRRRELSFNLFKTEKAPESGAASIGK